MWIDVRIPYGDPGLADAYNQALRESSAEWLLFLDHDVFLCNPLWYEISKQAILDLKEWDPKAACIGCKAGGEHHKSTMRRLGVPNSDIAYHIEQSRKQWRRFGPALDRVKRHIAGYFLLVNKEAALAVGGFEQKNNSINNVDQLFGQKLLDAGYHIFELPGLYIYHRRGMKHLKKHFTSTK